MEKPTAFAELLVELSDPATLSEFQHDPNTFLTDRKLTEQEKEALLTKNSGLIRYYAKGISDRIISDSPETMPRVVAALALDVIEVIEVVEVVVVAEAKSSLFIDKEGKPYLLQNDSQKS